jgi:hypothetical protein
MRTHTKTVFLGTLSLVALLALPPLVTARDNSQGQPEQREYRSRGEHRSRGELRPRDRRSFETYLDTHWETAQLLYQQPELINDRQFLRDHRALRNWLAEHERAARVIRANPSHVLWERRSSQPQLDRPVSAEDVQSLDGYLDTHWEEADALYREPELINDARFVQAHPSLDTWLQERPHAAQAIRQRPRDFFWRQRAVAPQDFLRQLFN